VSEHEVVSVAKSALGQQRRLSVCLHKVRPTSVTRHRWGVSALRVRATFCHVQCSRFYSITYSAARREWVAAVEALSARSFLMRACKAGQEPTGIQSFRLSYAQ